MEKPDQGPVGTDWIEHKIKRIYEFLHSQTALNKKPCSHFPYHNTSDDTSGNVGTKHAKRDFPSIKGLSGNLLEQSRRRQTIQRNMEFKMSFRKESEIKREQSLGMTG